MTIRVEDFSTDAAVYGESQRTVAGRRWWSQLPELAADLVHEWQLQLERPFRGGSASWVAPGKTQDGSPCVLKISLPHREAEHEAEALEHWQGVGSARLYRHDPDRWALLLERCDPGVALEAAPTSDEEKLGSAATVLRRLWSRPVPSDAKIPSLSDVTRQWATLVRERMSRLHPPIDAGLVEVGAELLERLHRMKLPRPSSSTATSTRATCSRRAASPG